MRLAMLHSILGSFFGLENVGTNLKLKSSQYEFGKVVCDYLSQLYIRNSNFQFGFINVEK